MKSGNVNISIQFRVQIILRPVTKTSVSFDSGTPGIFGGYSISFVLRFYGNNEQTDVELTTLQKSGVYVENTLEDFNVAF